MPHGLFRMQDLNAMIDAAKYADLVLLLVDGAFGFEMETFEFLNILQVSPFSACCDEGVAKSDMICSAGRQQTAAILIPVL